MKYKFRRLNCVQETDSEDRKKELLQKGFVLESEDGKPVKSTGISKETVPPGVVISIFILSGVDPVLLRNRTPE